VLLASRQAAGLAWLEESKNQGDEQKPDAGPAKGAIVGSDPPTQQNSRHQHQREFRNCEWAHELSLLRLVNRFTPSRKAGVDRASALAMIPAEIPSRNPSVSSL
jgi:hypothetical protein